jgi:hypothetical protein
MSPSNVNLFILLWCSAHASEPPRLERRFPRMYLPSALGLADKRTRFLFSFPVDAKGKGSEEWLNCFQSTCCQKIYATLGRIMFHCVRTTAGVLVGNFWKIQLQDLSSFLYASKRCSSRGFYGTFNLAPE